MRNIKEHGITLLALVITIIILIILATVTINIAIQSNIMEGAKWASFVTEFKTVEEAEKLYEISYIEENDIHYAITEKTYSLTDIEETLKEQIQEKENLSELSSSNTELHEVDMEKIGVNVNKVYVINSKSGMLYRLEGEKYQGKVYHRPNSDSGIAEVNEEPKNKVSREMNYLVATGSQYVHTGIIPDQNTTVEMKYQLLSRKSQFLFGARFAELDNSNSSSFTFLKYLGNDDSEYYRTDYKALYSNITDSYDGIHIVKKDKEKTYIDGVLKSTNSIEEFTSPNDLTLFNVNTNGSINNIYNAKLKFYYCKIWDNGTLVRDFVPVMDYNEKACLYDKLNDKLYYPDYVDQQVAFLTDEDFIEFPIITRASQYIDTDFKPDSNTKIELKCKINDISNQFLFGARTDHTLKTFSCVYLDGNTFRFDYGTVQNSYSSYSIRNIYTFTIDKGDFYIGDTKLGSANETFTTDYNLYLFAVNDKGTANLASYMTFYYCKIWDNDVLVRDFVPTLDSNNKYCLYDKVEKKYYYSLGDDFVLSNV